MSEPTNKPQRVPRAKGPRVYIVTIDGFNYYVRADDFRVSNLGDQIGLLNGDIKPLTGASIGGPDSMRAGS